MSDEELEQDEIEGADEDDGEDVPADDSDSDVDDGDGDGDSAEAAPSRKGKAKVVVEEEELPSVEAKQGERDALAKAMEDFLARGGKVQEIDPNVVADPPKKPENKYGSRPI